MSVTAVEKLRGNYKKRGESARRKGASSTLLIVKKANRQKKKGGKKSQKCPRAGLGKKVPTKRKVLKSTCRQEEIAGKGMEQ